MTRKIKGLSLGLIVMAVLGMAAAASVQAFQMHVTTQSNTVITGQQTKQFVLTTNAGTVVCTTATFEGKVAGQGAQQITSSHTTLTPTLSGCTAFGQAATVKPNGCKFTITGEGAPALTANVDITGCTSGKQLEVIAGGGICTFTAPEQHNVSHVVFSNVPGTPHHANADVTLTGVTYELHGLCPGATSTVVTTNGSTAGQATIRTYKETGTEQVTQHGHQFVRSLEGEQVGILAT